MCLYINYPNSGCLLIGTVSASTSTHERILGIFEAVVCIVGACKYGLSVKQNSTTK